MQTTVESTKQDQDVNPTDMVHIVWNEPDMVAMCGAKLNGNFRDDDPVDCVVCAELDASA